MLRRKEEMITEKELMTKLYMATGATDFLIIFKREFSSKDCENTSRGIK
jgi:hypothetical protein